MTYPISLQKAEKNVRDLILAKRDYISNYELKRLRVLRDQIGGAKKWSERLWKNYEYLMMINQ